MHLPATRTFWRAQADEMHLDPLLLAIVEGAVPEFGEVEIAVELAVHPLQQVEVERGGDAGGVVVGGVEDRGGP